MTIDEAERLFASGPRVVVKHGDRYGFLTEYESHYDVRLRYEVVKLTALVSYVVPNVSGYAGITAHRTYRVRADVRDVARAGTYRGMPCIVFTEGKVLS